MRWASLVLALIGCGPSSAPAPKASDWRAQIAAWRPDEPIPSVPLVDQDGQAFALADLDDAYLLVGEIYTACRNPEACPLTTARMAAVQAAWLAEPRTARLHLLSLTLDPAHDTPAVLREYALAHGASPTSWTFATGDASLMTDGLPSLFNVLSLPGDDGALNHTVKVVLLAPGRRYVTEWKDNEMTPDDVIGRISTAP